MLILCPGDGRASSLLLQKLVANGQTPCALPDKASGDESRLVLDNGAVLVPLDLIHPLQADRTTSWRWIDELSSLVFLDRLHLLQHRPSPMPIVLASVNVGGSSALTRSSSG